MNWLAHIYLSPPQIHFQLGNLLSDVGKGRVSELRVIHPLYQAGWELHRYIDHVTDHHPLFIASKNMLDSNHPTPSRRLGGVIIDIIFDHFLAKDWELYHHHTLEVFLQDFYRKTKAQLHKETYPEWATYFLRYITTSNQLNRYQNLGEMLVVLQKLDRRISKTNPLIERREKLVDYWERLTDRGVYLGIEENFHRFFPWLIDTVNRYLSQRVG